jgi:hypothetical protein
MNGQAAVDAMSGPLSRRWSMQGLNSWRESVRVIGAATAAKSLPCEVGDCSLPSCDCQVGQPDSGCSVGDDGEVTP